MTQTPDVRSPDPPEDPAGTFRGTGPHTAAPHTVRRWPLVLLRTVSTLFFVLVLLQPVLAGMFISGDVDLLKMHETNSHVITFAGWIQVLAALLVWRPGRGPVWPVGVAVLLSVAVVMQDGWGYGRRLDLHIPLGVILVSAATALVYWSFARRPGPVPGSGTGRGRRA